jgi:GNAT superfamily N-acetyltransferase
LRQASAEIESVVTAPLWHGMGLETALITTAIRATLEHKCDIVFTIAPSDAATRLYRALGFVDLTHVMTFWQAEEYSPFADETKTPAEGRVEITQAKNTSTPEGAG